MEILRDYNKIPLMDITKEHLKTGRSFSEPLLRPGSDDWSNFVDEVKNLIEYGFIKLDDEENEIINSSIGTKSVYEGVEVVLEVPTLIGVDPLSNTSLYEVFINDGGKTRKINFVNEDVSDDEHDMLVNEMFYVLENSSFLINEEKDKDDRCTRIAKRKYDVWPSAYASGAVVKCRKGEIWSDLKEEILEINEGFLSNRLSKFRDVPKIKSKNKLINLYKEFNDLDLNDADENEKAFLSNFNLEMLLLKSLSKCDLNKSDIDLIKMYSNYNDNYKKFEEYMNHPLKEVLDWDIEEKFKKEKDEGLHGWFSRNNGKGWIDCKKSSEGNLVPCGRNDKDDREYPACRPTLSACKGKNKAIDNKKGKSRVDWEVDEAISLEERKKNKKRSYFKSILSFPYYGNFDDNSMDNSVSDGE